MNIVSTTHKRETIRPDSQEPNQRSSLQGKNEQAHQRLAYQEGEGLKETSFIVQIVPMGAVRMTRRGKFVSESAHRYLTYKDVIALNARQFFEAPTSERVKVALEFYYPIPQSWTKVKKSRALNGEIFPTVKPDIDNVVKGIFDALNMIAWNDDSQVTDLHAIKRYAEVPYVKVTVTEW